LRKDYLKPIPNSHKKNWRVWINGELVNVQHVAIEHPDFGIIEYGLRPENYDGYIIQQPGGGGSVIVPYFIKNDELLIGLVLQYRAMMGGKVWNLPRGYLDPGENHLETAIRETNEETGFDPAKRIYQINTKPMNSDNSMFLTEKPNDGVHYFAFQVHPDEVEATTELGRTYCFKDGIVKPRTPDGEKIFSCIFFPLNEVFDLRDQYSVVGAIKLKRHIDQLATAKDYGYC